MLFLRRVNYDREIALASVMTKHIRGTPEDLAVPPRLCLEDKVLKLFYHIHFVTLTVNSGV